MRKKLQLVLLIATIGFTTVKAQDIKGKSFLNAGVGVGFAYYGGIGGLPFHASYEYGVTDNISAGVSVGYWSNNYLGDKLSSTFFSARGSYHLNDAFEIKNKQLDVYAGLGLGFHTFNSSLGGGYTWGSGVYLGAIVGGRYYFKDNIGAFAEIGYDLAWLKVGAAFKF